MEFIDHLVGHGKIHGCKIAAVKLNSSQRHIIDGCCFKITIGKDAIYKGDRFKGTRPKITVYKGAVFKLFVGGIGIVKNLIVEFLVQYIIRSHSVLFMKPQNYIILRDSLTAYSILILT